MTIYDFGAVLGWRRWSAFRLQLLLLWFCNRIHLLTKSNHLIDEVKTVLTRYSFLSFLVLAIFLPAQASAQDQSPWKTICVDEKNNETCLIKQELFLNREVDGKEQNIGRVLALTVLHVGEGDPPVRNAYLSLEMPLGVDLRPGAVIRVDEGPEIPIPYLQCTQAGCAASVYLGPDVLKAFRAGSVLSVGFRPWGNTQVQVVQASLSGFTRAFSGIR